MTRPTLVSLAAELGVSRQTISNVLNAPERVAPATRERVEQAIRASGYRPSAAARSLRSRKAMSIAFRLSPVGDGINGSLMDRFLHTLVKACEARHYSVLVFTAASDEEELTVLAELAYRDLIDGCVLTETHAQDIRPAGLREVGLPFVTLGRPWGDSSAWHTWVDVDGRAGTALATQYVLESGFRRIGFIGWASRSELGDDRRAGWQETMLTAGAASEDLRDWQALVDDGMAQGSGAARTLLSRGCEALVCASDSLAAGALSLLRQHGYADTPVRVIGFDGTPVARALGLSSIAQPVEKAAEDLIGYLLDELRQPGLAPHQELLTPALALSPGHPLW